jgi:hypothetical protein
MDHLHWKFMKFPYLQLQTDNPTLAQILLVAYGIENMNIWNQKSGPIQLKQSSIKRKVFAEIFTVILMELFVIHLLYL